jgi:OOP family OmpA-OmpF porin
VLYAQKGLAAARSEIVLPFELKDWGLPANKVDEMTEARATMMALLNQSARTKVPAAAADAQGKFDCWVEQQTENHQPNDIAACRTAFYAALDIIKAEMAPPAPAAAPAPQAEPAPTTFTVYFPLNSTEFTVATQNVLIKAIQAARQTGSAVLIVGHTDTTGSAGYNMALSVKRADAVKAAFERSGVSDVRIRASGVGETDLAEPTADNVENGFNRRVTITFE